MTLVIWKNMISISSTLPSMATPIDIDLKKKNAATIFNPGECAGHMVGYNAVGVIDLNGMTTELIKF